MNESTAKKIFIYFFVIGAVLFSIWYLSRHVHFMMSSEPTAIEVTAYTFARGKAQNNRSNASIVFLVAEGPYKGKGHSMKIFSSYKLHAIGTVTPGRYHPATGVMITNKYGNHLTFWRIILLLTSGFMLWGSIKYSKDI